MVDIGRMHVTRGECLIIFGETIFGENHIRYSYISYELCCLESRNTRSVHNITPQYRKYKKHVLTRCMTAQTQHNTPCLDPCLLVKIFPLCSRGLLILLLSVLQCGSCLLVDSSPGFQSSFWLISCMTTNFFAFWNLYPTGGVSI